MAELENTNPVMDNPGNPVNPEPTSEPEQAPDFSQLFSENITESTPIQQSEPAPSVDTVATQPIQEESVAPSVPVNQPTEAPAQETETPNFEKEIEHTTLDNSQGVQATQLAAAQQKATLEQQKLAWLKKHESKAKKSGFASGILSGILLMLLAFAACSVFAKDQVLNAMDYLNSVIPTNNLSFLNKNHNQIIENAEVLNNDIEETEVIEEETSEEVDPIQEYYDIVDEIVSSENDQETKVEQLRNVLSEVMQEGEETDEELVQYISQTIMDLTINTEESQNEENNEQEVSENTNEEPIEENNEPTETIEEENAEPYTITYVNSEEEANWVLPAHCSDLTCYGEDKEFTPCTSFKMVETLDENSNRISSRGGCRYKDASELVYVKINNDHNSANTFSDPSLSVEIDITPNTNIVISGVAMYFKALTNETNDIINYEWNFGDGKITSGQSTTEIGHIYSQKGTYSVTLTVYDKNGNSNTSTKLLYL